MKRLQRNTKSRGFHTGRLPRLLLSMLALVISFEMAACDLYNDVESWVNRDLGTLKGVRKDQAWLDDKDIPIAGTVIRGNNAMPIKANMVIEDGDKVTFFDPYIAYLTLFDGQVIFLKPTGTQGYVEINVDYPCFTTVNGRAYVETKNSAQLFHKTPTINVLNNMTGFGYAFDSRTRVAEVIVVEGSVTVTPIDPTVNWKYTLGPNQGLRVTGTQDPGEPTFLTSSGYSTNDFFGWVPPDSLR